ncbi:MAG: PorV/PorQ family protein [Ignavibacteria bacterium]|nr:PorV/PorQ family protein [Ignavibacteria bacterium]
MRIVRLLVATAILAACLVLHESNSQIVKKAQVGFRFLENPVSAEVVGRGMVGVATTLSSSGIFWNPGLISWIPGDADLSIHHTQGIADINYNAAAATVRLGNIGVAGLSLIAMDYGTFYGTRRAPNEQGYIETGTFSPTAYAVGIAFSQKVSDRFSYGVHLKHARQDLGDAWVAPAGSDLTDPNLSISARRYAQYGLALDVGGYHDFLFNGIRFGACLRNISREIRYENEAFPMPFAVCFGATVEPLRFFTEQPDDVFTLSFESRRHCDFNEKLKLGAEYYYLKTFIARVSYATNYDERGLMAGVGFRYKVAGSPCVQATPIKRSAFSELSTTSHLESVTETIPYPAYVHHHHAVQRPCARRAPRALEFRTAAGRHHS